MENDNFKIRARHANGASIVKDGAEFEPLKTSFEPTEQNTNRFTAGDKALCNGRHLYYMWKCPKDLKGPRPLVTPK